MCVFVCERETHIYPRWRTTVRGKRVCVCGSQNNTTTWILERTPRGASAPSLMSGGGRRRRRRPACLPARPSLPLVSGAGAPPRGRPPNPPSSLPLSPLSSAQRVLAQLLLPSVPVLPGGEPLSACSAWASGPGEAGEAKLAKEQEEEVGRSTLPPAPSRTVRSRLSCPSSATVEGGRRPRYSPSFPQGALHRRWTHGSESRPSCSPPNGILGRSDTGEGRRVCACVIGEATSQCATVTTPVAIVSRSCQVLCFLRAPVQS